MQLARFWTFTFVTQRKCAERSFVLLTQQLSTPFDKDPSFDVAVKTVEIVTSCLLSLVPFASSDWNL